MLCRMLSWVLMYSREESRQPFPSLSLRPSGEDRPARKGGEEPWYWGSSLGLQSGEVVQAVGNRATPSLFSLTIRSHSSSSSTSISVAMETSNGTEAWYKSLHAVLKALNATLHSHLLCRPGPGLGSDNQTEERRASLPGRNDNSYMYILFVMFLFAVTVGSLILGYTRSRKVDKRSDPYHVYIKNRVSMIWCEVPKDDGRLRCLRIVFLGLQNSTLDPLKPQCLYLYKINKKLVRNWNQRGGAGRLGLVYKTFFPDKDRHYILGVHWQIYRNMDYRRVGEEEDEGKWNRRHSGHMIF